MNVELKGGLQYAYCEGCRSFHLLSLKAVITDPTFRTISGLNTWVCTGCYNDEPDEAFKIRIN